MAENPSEDNPNSFLEPCEAELFEANVCVQANSEDGCECFDPGTFLTTFAKQIRQQFYSAMALVPVTDPDFCSVANQRVCDHFGVMQSCCCQMQTTAYRQCLFDTVLVKELPVPDDCKDICERIVTPKYQGVSSSETTTDKSALLGAGIFMLALGVAFFLYYKRASPNLHPVSDFNISGSEKEGTRETDDDGKSPVVVDDDGDVEGGSEEDLNDDCSDLTDMFGPKWADDSNTIYSDCTDQPPTLSDDCSDLTDIFGPEWADDSNTIYSDCTDQSPTKRFYPNKDLEALNSGHPRLEPVDEANEDGASSQGQSPTDKSSRNHPCRHHNKSQIRPSSKQKNGKLNKSEREMEGHSSPGNRGRLENHRSNTEPRLDAGPHSGTSKSRKIEDVIKERNHFSKILKELEMAQLSLEAQMESCRQEIQALSLDHHNATTATRLTAIINTMAAISMRVSQMEKARGYGGGRLEAATKEIKLIQKKSRENARKQEAIRDRNFHRHSDSDSISVDSSSTGSKEGERRPRRFV
jgi:hypothetical protein